MLGTYKFNLPRFLFLNSESIPEFIFEGIVLFYDIAFCEYLWIVLVDLRSFFDVSPFRTA